MSHWAGAQGHYPFVGLLVAVGVERGHDVNAGLLHQADDACIAGQVLLAEELHQQQQQLTPKHLVAMGPCDVVELGLPWTQRREKDGFWSHWQQSSSCHLVLGQKAP